MSRKHSESDRELNFMKGAWEWVSDIEVVENVRVEVVILRKGRAGVFLVEARLISGDTGTVGHVLAKASKEWPNGDNQTLSGLILAEIVTLDRMADEIAMDAAGNTWRAHTEG